MVRYYSLRALCLWNSFVPTDVHSRIEIMNKLVPSYIVGQSNAIFRDLSTKEYTNMYNININFKIENVLKHHP
jgi:uncharacterized Fe-S radical SAM superfamily protein PflX